MKKIIFALAISILFMLVMPFQTGHSLEDKDVPVWIETNVNWWSEGKLSDVEFFNGINWLVEKEIIVIPQIPPEHHISNEIIKIKEWKESFAQEIIEQCGNDGRCASVSLQKVSQYNEHKSVMKTYYDLLDYYKQTNFSCHAHAHLLGMFLYGYLQNVTQSIEYTDPVMCGGSILHGIAQNYIESQVVLNKNDPSKVNISTICPQNSETDPTIARWECIHGIGHGVDEIYGYDVFSASERCGEFEQSWERTSCSKGLFMANVGNYYKTGIGAVDEIDLFFPCNIVDEKFAPACYHYQARHVFMKSQEDFKTALQSCENAPNGFEKYCIRGLGNGMAFYVHSNYDFSDLCQTIQSNFQSDCYKGIVMKFADNRSIKEALEFCKLIPNEFQSDCYGEVGKWIRMVYFEPFERLEACLISDNMKYFETCMKTDFIDLPIL